MSKKTHKHKTVETLEARDCRWPIGDPRDVGFHFCGAQSVEGRPYCDLHWRMSFTPARPRNEGAAAAIQANVALLTSKKAA